MKKLIAILFLIGSTSLCMEPDSAKITPDKKSEKKEIGEKYSLGEANESEQKLVTLKDSIPDDYDHGLSKFLFKSRMDSIYIYDEEQRHKTWEKLISIAKELLRKQLISAEKQEDQ